MERLDPIYVEKAEILELLHRYAYAVDRDKFADMKNIFADGARFRLTGMPAGEWDMSVPEYIDFVSPIIKSCTFVVHSVTNTVIEVNGASATALSYLSTLYGVKAGVAVAAFGVDSPTPTDVSLGAEYQDKLVKTAQGWRITERICKVLYQRERTV